MIPRNPSFDERARHVELWRQRERCDPVDFLVDALCVWRVEHDLPPVDPEGICRHPAPLDRGILIAELFERAPDASDDPIVREAYRSLVRQTSEMVDFVTTRLGITLETTTQPGVEPYPDSTTQSDDVRLNRRLITEVGLGGNHPLMSSTEYNQFRAMHDLFGHAALGVGFDRHGEYQSFLAHCALYEGLGRWAMASEYRGVNSSLWAGSAVGAGKAVLLPRALVFDHPLVRR